MTFKQKIGQYIFSHMPISRHVFDHFRLELTAIYVRILHRIHPYYIFKILILKRRKDLLVNLGCGPFGFPCGWVNLDLAPIKNVYLRTDCRKKIPLTTDSCLGIHVEMFLEHLDPIDELPYFLSECRRVLQDNGILRIIVPDVEKFLKAYFHEGWSQMNEISYGFEDWSQLYTTKIEALNHVFLQGHEHYGAWDKERMIKVLEKAKFSTITFFEYKSGQFPFGSIDREYHQQNGLYVEAKR